MTLINNRVGAAFACAAEHKSAVNLGCLLLGAPIIRYYWCT